ncbi:MAG: hypothetical protein ACI4RA_05455 [Kiritimatiellia bacterium]
MAETANDSVNVICMKWGTFYTADYINRLYCGVRRHLSRPFRFVCFTNEPEGIRGEVEIQPIPAPPPGYPRRWPSVYAKLAVFRDGFGGLRGPTLFLDIDQIIIGDLDRFFDYRPGEFCIIHNWIELRKRIVRRRPAIGNSSCFRFEAGKMNGVWQRFCGDLATAIDKRRFTTEQAFMTWAVGQQMKVNWWPEDWVLSFKRACHRIFPLNLVLAPKRPRAGSILCFHGAPNPNEAVPGYTEHRGQKAAIHQRTRPAPWVGELWEADCNRVENRQAFLRGKYLNDVFYTGMYEGTPCIEKHSRTAAWSIGNEYRMLRRIAEQAPALVPRPLAYVPYADGDGASVVVERIDGITLTEKIRRGVSSAEADAFARDIDTLAAALKRANIVHRDLMGDNLMLAADGHLKAIDWQLAVDRGDVREDPWVERHWKFRYVVFGVNRDLGFGVWNDFAALGGILAQLPQTETVREVAARLAAQAGELSAVARPNALTRVKLALYAVSLRFQMVMRRGNATRHAQLERRYRTIIDGFKRK